MKYGAIDLHKKQSEIRIVRADGSGVHDERIVTTAAAFRKVFGGRGSMRILVESSTESEWVAQCLEAEGHELIVADPNYLPMYGQRSRAIKTDRRDVAALAEACRLGLYRPAHRLSAAMRTVRQQLQVRRALVQTRSGLICQARSFLRAAGLRLASGQAESFRARLAKLAVPPALDAVLEPIRVLIDAVTAQVTLIEAALEPAATPAVQHLMTAPGVGPIVALTFHATLDQPARFGGSAAKASAYVGLVPSEDSSAERRLRGHITKTGPSDLRALLVQASWTIWRGRSAEGEPLRTWGKALAARRGRRIAMVALARRLCRILYALWRDQTDFQLGGRKHRLPAHALAS